MHTRPRPMFEAGPKHALSALRSLQSVHILLNNVRQCIEAAIHLVLCQYASDLLDQIKELVKRTATLKP